MNERVKAMFEAAQKLPPEEREELAELLLATIDVDPEIEKAWAEEAHRRWDEHLATDGKTIDALDAVEGARRDLKRRGKA